MSILNCACNSTCSSIMDRHPVSSWIIIVGLILAFGILCYKISHLKMEDT
jgi:hypothetical protein